MATQGDQAVAIAKTWFGVPYLYGGSSRSGVDCSGLVQQVFASMGIKIPRTTDTQSVVGKGISNLANALPGDCCYFGPAGHVGSGTNGHTGIYVGGGVMIDAPHRGTVVRYDNVGGFTGQETLAAIRRFWDDSGVPVDPNSITDTGSDSGTGSVDLTAAKTIDHCQLHIKIPVASSIPVIGKEFDICLWQEGWSRALLGGLVIAGGSLALVLGAILLSRTHQLAPIMEAGSQISNITSMFRTG
jgi:hypothetical protein